MLVKLFHSSAGDLNSERHSSTPKNVHVFERLPCWDMTLAGGGRTCVKMFDFLHMRFKDSMDASSHNNKRIRWTADVFRLTTAATLLRKLPDSSSKMFGVI